MSTQLPAVTVVGSINLDIIATADRLPTAGETLGGGVLQQQPGGKGANQAVAAARLGASSRMIGAVGDDASGRLMLESLSGAGVDTADVAVLDGGATGTALIVVDRDGENQIVVCPGANAGFSLEGVEFGPDETVLCQLEVGLPVVLEAARRSAGFFVLNAAPAMDLPAELLERCDLVIVNETEYELIPALARGQAGGGDVREGRVGDVRARAEGGRGSGGCRDGGEHHRRGRRVLRCAGAGARGRGSTTPRRWPWLMLWGRMRWAILRLSRRWLRWRSTLPG